ncbi:MULTISPECIES: sensor histidine kinase [Sutcliffiella]|uniref:histidine kinase n=1 Tax=Sutcliffiella cohnii TaxID=33932 RepID=A0A223KNP3_9BACI|nr:MULTISPECIES: ATP-binding protein [Sutcliffiella]AST91026.1 hypothetical protein BC6307_06905 [Sutcliffiella cohnii]WBL16824.1 ATP-binding protein [Sutcliffiella sp. NC1]
MDKLLLRRYTNQIVFFLIIVYIIIFLFFVSFSFKHPFLGVIVNEEENQYYIKGLRVVEFEKEFDLNIGDKIIKVNHKSVSEHETIKWNIIELASHIILEEENGGIKEVNIFEYYTWKDFSRVFLLAITSLVCIITGTYTFIKLKKHKIKGIYFMLNYFIALALISSISSGLMHIPSLTILLIVFPFIPNLLIYLYLNFPKDEKYNLFTNINAFLVMINILIVSTNIIDIFLLDFTYHYWIKRIWIILFLLGVLLFLVLLVTKSLRTKDPVIKNQIKLLNVTFLFIFMPAIIFGIIPSFINVNPIIIPTEFLVLSFNLLPIVFSYVMVKNKIIDVNIYQPKIIYYTVILLISIIAYYLWTSIVSSLVMKTDLLPFTDIIGIILLVLLVLQLMKILPKLILRKLFGLQDNFNQHNHDLLLKLVKSEHAESVMEFVLTSIHKIVAIDSSAIVIINEDGREYFFATGKYLLWKDELLKWCQHDRKAINKRFNSELSTSKEIICQYKGKYKVHFFIGEKINGSRLEPQEVKQLEEMLDIAAEVIFTATQLKQLENEKMFLNNSRELIKHKLHDVQSYNQQLVEVQENEKKELSMYLHDHILQSVISLNHSLEAAMQDIKGKYYMCTKEEMNQAVRMSAKLMHDLREKCFDLYPGMIDDLGFLRTCEYYFLYDWNNSKLRLNYKVDLTDKDLDNISKADQKIIFRSLKELVKNVEKHSKATELTILMKKEGNTVNIQVNDNGIGFEINNNMISEFLQKKHIGIASVKQSVEKMGGLLDIYSTKGKGTSIHLNININ